MNFSERFNARLPEMPTTALIASAPFLAEPYKGSDTYITKDGLMQAMVTTFDGAALKMKK